MLNDQKPLNLTTDEAAERLRVGRGTLANWRVHGIGPRFAKFGSRVLYPVTEIEAFERAQVRQQTAEQH